MFLLAAAPVRDKIRAWEVFAQCRRCGKPSTILIQSLNAGWDPNAIAAGAFINDDIYDGFSVVTIIPGVEKAPEHTPEEMASRFNEAEKCRAIGAFDASGTMFRKVVDMATRGLLPVQPASDQHPDFIAFKRRKDLRLRLEVLLERNLLSARLRPLVECIREDGNEAAHGVDGIGREEAEDLLDFTTVLLEELFTLPGQIAENIGRRERRRQSGADAER